MKDEHDDVSCSYCCKVIIIGFITISLEVIYEGVPIHCES